MPEVGDYSRHLQGVDAHLQRSSNQGWAQRCYCGRGMGSETLKCPICYELSQDLKPPTGAVQKPLQLPNLRWKSAAEIPPAPAPTPAAATAPEVVIPFGCSPVKRTTRARSSTSDERDHQARTSPRISAPSPYLHSHGQRGRPPNGSRVGPVGFKGVRQRKGVRGYLVEIRPPKWKKTIWLGTYNSDREAAGAYDAGVFYTNKKTKYNFPSLEGTFPPLPAQLRLDNAGDSDEIKTFVQQEAREAARRVKTLAAPIPEPARTVPTGVHPSGTAVSSPTSSSDESSEEMGLPILDDEEWLHVQQMISGPAAFLDFPGWTSPPFGVNDMKQEEISLDLDSDPGVHLGFMHPLP